MITALNIANNFLEKAFRENVPITPMKLQKLVYILYKQYLKLTGKSLFSERFEVWQTGPVLPNIYSKFKNYKDNPIKSYSLDSDGGITKVKVIPMSDFDYVLTDVWNNYKKYNGLELTSFTIQDDTAWKKAVEQQTYILEDNDIYNEFDY